MIEWNKEKAEWLLSERGIDIKRIEHAIKSGDYTTAIVPNQEDHPEQEMFLVELDDYIHCVPFVKNGDTIFIKTVFRSRKLQKRR
jgi:uncharacterized DUF497 family protein